MSNICFETGTTPVTKILFKSMLGPCIMTFLLVLYCIQAIMSKYIFSHSTFWKSFKVCLERAFLLSVLFSYQQLLVAAFILIQCVEIFGKMVLFVQAEIQCFTMWQYLLQVFLYLNILPTFLVLSHASFYVAENKMSSGIFILTCLFPIPTIIIYHFARYFHPAKPKEPADLEMRNLPSVIESNKSDSTSDIEGIIESSSVDPQGKHSVNSESDVECKSLTHSTRTDFESESSEKISENTSKRIEDELLDSGKEITKNMLDHYKTLKLFGFRFTWLAIHKMYRIALVACNTYLTDPLVRLFSMTILLIFIFAINSFIKPYKKNETNAISTLSYLFNTLIAIFNICKACLERFSCKTNCSSRSVFINYVEVIENVLLVYVPISIISLFMIIAVLKKCKKKDKSE